MSKNKGNNKTSHQDPFDDKVILALFQKGAHEYLENMLNDLPDSADENEPGPSEVFNKKIENMITRAIRKEKKKHRVKRIPRIAAVVIAVIVICSITVMSVEAFRVPFLNLFVNTEEEITDIEYEEDQASDEGSSQSDLFGYIPDGYELTVEDVQEQAATFIYFNENEEKLLIRRYYGEGSSGIDTENADYNEISINDYQGFYSTKHGITTLVFTKNGYAYFIQAYIDLSEIVKIAENIK